MEERDLMQDGNLCLERAVLTLDEGEEMIIGGFSNRLEQMKSESRTNKLIKGNGKKYEGIILSGSYTIRRLK